MPSPIVPTFRVTFPMTTKAFDHVMHFYLDCVASADPSGRDTVARTGHSNVGVSTIFAPLWTILAPFFSATDTVFGNGHLDSFFGGAWIPLYYETNAVTPSGGGSAILASVDTYSGYAENHERMKDYLMESIQGGIARDNVYAALSTGKKALVNTLYNSGGTAVDTSPFAWRKSRDGHFPLTWIASTRTFSKHWRRKRGLG